MRRTSSIAFGLLVIPWLASCGIVKPIISAGDAVGAMACPAVKDGNVDKLELTGDAKVAFKVRSFIKAVYDMRKAEAEASDRLMRACRVIARETGASKQEVKRIEEGSKLDKKKDPSLLDLPDNVSYDPLPAMCERAAQGVANAKLSVKVELQEPSCAWDVDEATACLAGCGEAVDPGALALACKGGTLRGQCDGACEGQCEGSPKFACEGACDATCAGACTAGFKGHCGGNCKGACDGTSVEGACAGECEGTCDASADGSCSGTCEGDCSGSCVAAAKVHCDGECAGGCSGSYEKLRCDGTFEPPTVDATCHTLCASKAASALKCEPATAWVTVSGTANAKLIKALEVAIPEILDVVHGSGARLLASAEAVGKAAVDLKDSLGDVGGDTVKCLGAGVAASAKVTVSMQAKVEAVGSTRGFIGAAL